MKYVLTAILAILITHLPTNARAAIDHNEKLLRSLQQLNGLETAAGEASGSEPQNVVPPSKTEKPAAVSELSSDKTWQLAQTRPQTKAKSAPKKAAPRKISRSATTWFSSFKEGYRLTVTFNSRPRMTYKRDGKKITFFFTAPVNYKPPTVPSKFRENYKSVVSSTDDKGNLIITVELQEGAEDNISFNKRRVFIDTTNPLLAQKKKEEELAKQAPQKKAEEPKTEQSWKKGEEEKEVEVVDGKAPVEKEKIREVELKKGKKPALKKVIDEIKVTFLRVGDIEKLRFEFGKDTPAASFRRFGNYWMVFDNVKPFIAPKNFAKSNLFESFDLKQDKDKGVTFIKLPLKQNVFAKADNNYGVWEFEFDPKIKYELDKKLEPQEKLTYWEFDISGDTKFIQLNDEFYDEQILVFPLENDGSGIAADMQTREMIFLQTDQGIAVRAVDASPEYEISDDAVKIFLNNDKFSLSKKNRTGEALFPFEKWKPLEAKDFREKKFEILNEDKYQYYEYAKLHFEQKLYNEAAVTTRPLRGFNAQFLHAAASYLAGFYEEALASIQKLELPPNKDKNEMLMWLYAIQDGVSDYIPNRSEQINFDEGLVVPPNVINYPVDIASKVLLEVAEAMIDGEKIEIAQEFLDAFPKVSADQDSRNYHEHLQALIYNKTDKKARAREMWENLRQDLGDRKTRSRVLYHIARQDYEEGDIDELEFAEKINEARALWRGDQFEYDMLSKAGDLYAEGDSPLQALRSYREAVSYFPGNLGNDALTFKMRDIFRKTITKEFADLDKTFESLNLYYEFEELKPGGDEGDRVTLELAEKLVDFDLLTDAAKVLSGYLTEVVDNEEKSLIETRIAILQYMDNECNKALQTLDVGASRKMPAYLLNERQVLTVECMIEEKEYEKAMKALRKVPQERRAGFRAEIAWQQKNWEDMVAAYAEIPTKTDQEVLRLAIAHKILGNKRELRQLQIAHSQEMAESQYANSFAFLTDDKNLDYENLTATLKLDDAKTLLNDYRERLQIRGLDEFLKENEV